MVVRVAALLLIVVIAGCGHVRPAHPSDTQLLETIPAHVGDINVERSRLSGVPSGLPVDDAVMTLGKTRADMSVAGGEAPALTILAVAVRDVSGEDLEQAIVDQWPAATGGFPGTIAGRRILLLDHPSHDDIVVVPVGNVVYVVTSPDASLVTEAVSMLPTATNSR